MGLSGIRENLEERRIFPRSSGCEGSIFAAELPAPSKLQQWGCARFAISAARSAGASKDPQGAGQASKYVHCGSKGFKESQRGAARRGSVGFSVKASERTPKCLRRSWPHLQNFSSGPARAARYLQRALQGLPKIRRALHRPRHILLFEQL